MQRSFEHHTDASHQKSAINPANLIVVCLSYSESYQVWTVLIMLIIGWNFSLLATSNSKLAAMKHQNRGIVGSLVAYKRATFNRRKVPLFGSTVLSYSDSNDHSLKIE